MSFAEDYVLDRTLPSDTVDKQLRIRSSSRLLINPWDLQVEDIRISDMIEHLSCETRYCGARGFYSVLQHSRLVGELITHPLPGMTLAGSKVLAYAHDFEEAFLKDMPSPIKRQPEMEPYVEAGNRARSVIFTAIGLSETRAEHDRLVSLIHPFDGEMYHREVNSFDGRVIPESPDFIEREAPEMALYNFNTQWCKWYPRFLMGD